MNTFGNTFTFTSFGESHGRAIGGVLDGVPAGLAIDLDMIRRELNRRAGRDTMELGVSSRAQTEKDEVEWLSGVKDGISLGTPIAFLIRNSDARSEDYEWLLHTYRPGHADKTYELKYGIRDARGGGRASARETAARVVAGCMAKQCLSKRGIDIAARLVQVGAETCPDKFADLIADVQRQGDSIGGIVECRISGMPAGIGEPIFDKLQSHLAAAMMSINACKGFDYGSGFAQIDKRGSDLYLKNGRPSEDCSGGIAGGITTGEDIVFRCAFKPTPTSLKTLQAIAPKGVQVKGRWDACVAVRAVSVVEAMCALVIEDELR